MGGQGRAEQPDGHHGRSQEEQTQIRQPQDRLVQRAVGAHNRRIEEAEDYQQEVHQQGSQVFAHDDLCQAGRRGEQELIRSLPQLLGHQTHGQKRDDEQVEQDHIGHQRTHIHCK
ncbi:hypothetical protein D3C80_1770090 [compost metagenome]